MICLSQRRKNLYNFIKDATKLTDKQIYTNLAPVDENGEFLNIPMIIIERVNVGISQRNAYGDSQYYETVFTVSCLASSVETCDNLSYNIYTAIDNTIDNDNDRYYVDEIQDSFYNGKYPVSQVKIRIASTKF